jgi:hypothetical protein
MLYKEKSGNTVVEEQRAKILFQFPKVRSAQNKNRNDHKQFVNR